ncbi:site-specific integrase [Planctomonas psychrotolerans]|uniref:hypothetical protein n=1 Tax=Planctomonas psychrotolerans TaxID=2528712 RepID=UPI00123964AF|nr:hypothetical protein [Planctomonas psychrotolerans]
MTDTQYDYTPMIPAEHWTMISGFVRHTVREAAPLTAYSEKQLYPAAARLALWAWQTASLPLEADVVFSAPVIDRFSAEGLLQYTNAGRNTMRARLRRMADVLLGPDKDPDRHRPMGKSDPSAPYTQRDVSALRSWAASQGSEERRSSAGALLALGLGAGLAGKEIVGLRVADIEQDELGILVQVRGASARAVPVLRDWEQPLADRLSGAHNDTWAFRNGQEGGNPNLITDFVSRSYGRVNLQARRMRATWLVHHIAAGTPLVPLLRAAGLQSPEALGRFMRFVPAETDCETARRSLVSWTGADRDTRQEL